MQENSTAKYKCIESFGFIRSYVKGMIYDIHTSAKYIHGEPWFTVETNLDDYTGGGMVDTEGLTKYFEKVEE